MRLNFRALGAAVLAIAAAATVAPVLAQQQEPPLDAQGGPPPNGQPPGPPPNALPPGPGAQPPGPSPQADAPGPAKSGYATANVNLRGGPGTDAEVITTIPGGSRVRVTSCDGEWCAVTWNGRSGFAIARNLDTSGRPPQARPYRPQPGYAEGGPVYEAGPPVAYGPGYYGPPVVYAPGYYGYGYGRGYYGGYGWRRRW